MADSAALEQLQVKVAFLEQALADLSHEYYQQQRELSVLQRQYASLIDKLQTHYERDDKPDEDNATVLDERPPHY